MIMLSRYSDFPILVNLSSRNPIIRLTMLAMKSSGASLGAGKAWGGWSRAQPAIGSVAGTAGYPRLPPGSPALGLLSDEPPTLILVPPPGRTAT
jgi:hypothetical protein